MVPIPVWFTGGDLLSILLEGLLVGLVLLEDGGNVQSEFTMDVGVDPSHLSNVFEDNIGWR